MKSLCNDKLCTFFPSAPKVLKLLAYRLEKLTHAEE